MDLKDITIREIKSIVTVHSKRGQNGKMTDRPSYAISLCREGEIVYIQDGVEYVSDKGYAVILPKGKSYYIKRTREGYFPVINFDSEDHICDTVTQIPLQSGEELLSDYERLKNLSVSGGSRAQLFSILYGMLHKLGSDHLPYEMREAIRIIKADYCDPTLTNSRLAEECNISEVYLRKLFNKYFSTSPRQYVIDMRIQTAKQLLAEGVLKISVISEKCGFANQYHFSKIFRQHTGLSPTDYRRENMIYTI